MLEYFIPTLINITVVVCLSFGAVYLYLKKQYRYWKDRAVPGPEPIMVVGNMKEAYSLKCTEPEMMESWYKEYRNEPYVGFYNLWKPSLFIIDPEIIKKMTEIDFSYFSDHPKISGDTDNDAILRSLFTMKADQWKTKRLYFSRLFTPKRLREHSDNLIFYNSTLMKSIKEQLMMQEDIELCDVIGKHILRANMSSLFGLDLSNDEERIEMLDKYNNMFSRPDNKTIQKFLLFTVSPDLFTFLKFKTFPDILWKYFSALTRELFDLRKQTPTDRGDVVSMVSKLYKGESEQIEQIDFRESVGHIFSFFVAGYSTTQTTLCYTLFKLGQHLDIQKKVQNEIDTVLNGTNEISYESIKKLTYMEDVLNETMRQYPMLGVIKRTCTKNYKIDDKLIIPKGTDVVFPVQSLHMDPEYFPEPEKFQPERFSDLEKPPQVFMSFGKGPRSCIGTRMAFVSIKMAMAKILSEYTILPSTKTTHPIKYDVKTLFITCRPLNGVWVRMEKRERVK